MSKSLKKMMLNKVFKETAGGNCMIVKYYPDQEQVNKAIEVDDPLLMLISFDGSEILLSHIDDAVEHVILLRKLNYRETEIDKFFRVVIDREGADWTFVCPTNYKGISSKEKRIKTFYNDGVTQISKAMQTIGYNAEIHIPQRYRRTLQYSSRAISSGKIREVK